MGDNSRSLVENLFVPDSQCWLLILVWEVADVTSVVECEYYWFYAGCLGACGMGVRLRVRTRMLLVLPLCCADMWQL